MPRTILDKKPPQPDPLVVLICGTKDALKIRSDSLSDLIGMSLSTFYSRLNNPKDFTLDELRGIRRGLNIPEEKFREAITY